MSDVLVLEKLTKEFTKVIANKNINFTLRKGEVHALLGENGAGKTTLMNCVCGLYRPTSGSILVNGKEVNIKNCVEAVHLGIGMVHQHFMLVPELTVAENVILGMKRNKDFFIRIEEVEKEIKELSDQYDFNIDPKSYIKDLPVGIKQRVEILKTIYKKAEIIILDEATAVLTPQEANELFKIVENLAKNGKSIIIITHKLDEVMRLADRVTVLRDGEVVGTVNKKDTSEKELARMMVGREVLFDFKKRERDTHEKLLEIENLTVVDKNNIKKLNKLSFTLCSGEILGVAGVDGNGQIELSEAITGMIPFQEGKITIKSQVYKKITTKESYRNNVSHIPQDRQNTGLILEREVANNLILSDYWRKPYSNFGIIDKEHVYKHGKMMIEDYNIKAPGPYTKVKDLSGGNQQKIILAREIFRQPDILIAVQPTRGLDIGATEFVRQKLIDERDKGTAVLLISTELEEILQISDRIAIIYKGEFMGIIDNHKIDIENIGLMMAGFKNNKIQENNGGDKNESSK